jgi:hypothetical protein
MSINRQYETRVQTLKKPFFDGSESYVPMIRLLTELGCANDEPSMYAQQIKDNEVLVRRTVLQLLEYNQRMPSTVNSFLDKFSLLRGLLICDRWRSCLDTPSLAYDLAALLTSCALTCRPENVRLHDHYGPNVCALLNAWLAPDTALTMIPTAYACVGLLFGDSVRGVVVGSVSDELSTGALIHLIRHDRPAFRAGLVFF